MIPRSRWIAFAWAAWLVFIFVIAARPFLGNLNLFHQVDPRLYRLLLAILPLAVLAGVAYHFVRRRGFWRYEPVVLPVAFLLLLTLYAPLPVAVTIWITLAAFVTGRQLTDWLGIPASTSVAILAGLGLFSCVLFVIGMAGQFRAWVFAAMFALPLIAFWKKLSQLAGPLRWMRKAWVEEPEVAAPHVSLAVFTAIILALLTSAAVLTPAWDGDAIRAHLALARAYLIQHSVAAPPSLNYAYYPQGFEVLVSAAYALGGQTAAQMINPLFFCLALGVLYKIARVCGISRPWAVTGVVLGASVPYLHAAGSIVKNDLPMVAFQLAALLCYLRWREDSNFRWILAGVFFLAMSFDVKDVAIFGAVPLGLAFAHAVWRQPGKLRSALQVGVVLAVLGFFWQTRTYLAMGNPLYPAIATASSRVPAPLWKRIDRLYLLVWDHFHGEIFYYPSPNPLGILLLLLAPLWLIRPEDAASRRAERVLWFFLVVYYALWCYGLGVPRYGIALVSLLVVLGARRLDRFPKWLSLPAITGVLVFALPVTIILEMTPAQIPLLLKQIDGATFLRRTLPPYAAVEFLSQRASPSDRVASVGDWAVAYAPNPGNFFHVYLNTRRYLPGEVEGVLKQSQGRYLILPKSSNLKKLEATARQSYTLTRLYDDKDFVVYALAP